MNLFVSEPAAAMKVLVYGGRGGLGSALVSHFKQSQGNFFLFKYHHIYFKSKTNFNYFVLSPGFPLKKECIFLSSGLC